MTVIAASQSFSGITIVEANELPFKAALVAAVADKLKVDEEDVVITDIGTSKNGKEVVVEYQIEGESPHVIAFDRCILNLRFH